MGCLPCNPNGPAPGEAAYRGGGNPNGPIQHSLTGSVIDLATHVYVVIIIHGECSVF
jgi:hypothetical protein